MKKYLLAAALSVALAAPFSAKAANDFMIGGGFGMIDVSGTSVTGYVLGAQFKVNNKSGIALNYHEGEIFGGTFKYYLGRYTNGVFLEGGMLSGGGSTALVLGGGYETPLSPKVNFSAAGGLISASGNSAFGGRLMVYYEI